MAAFVRCCVAVVLSFMIIKPALASDEALGQSWYSAYFNANSSYTVVAAANNKYGIYLRMVNMISNPTGTLGIFADTAPPSNGSTSARPIYVIGAPLSTQYSTLNTGISKFIPPGNGLFILNQFAPGYVWMTYDVVSGP